MNECRHSSRLVIWLIISFSSHLNLALTMDITLEHCVDSLEREYSEWPLKNVRYTPNIKEISFFAKNYSTMVQLG